MEPRLVVTCSLFQDVVLVVGLVLFIGYFVAWIIHKREEGYWRRMMAAARGRTGGPPTSAADTYLSPLLGRRWTGREYGKAADETRLASSGLPVLRDPEALAQGLGITRGQLSWLTQHQEHDHYFTITIPKRGSSKVRLIQAPQPHLKRAQRWILKHILERVPPHPCSAAFAPGCSIVRNASQHAGRELVVRFDLRDFFPSIRGRRIKGVFRSLGYSEEMSILLTGLTTMRRGLPQGPPTSPALANLVCRGLDARLAGLAGRFGASYTRYADDLTFSGDRDFILGLKRFLPAVRLIVREEGFRLHKAKTRFARKGAQQRVTGLVVNKRAGVPRVERRRLRAILHNLSPGKGVTGREAEAGDLRAHLQGRIAFLSQAHPEEGARLKAILVSLPGSVFEG